jgi:hypothetical protein
MVFASSILTIGSLPLKQGMCSVRKGNISKSKYIISKGTPFWLVQPNGIFLFVITPITSGNVGCPTGMTNILEDWLSLFVCMGMTVQIHVDSVAMEQNFKVILQQRDSSVWKLGVSAVLLI